MVSGFHNAQFASYQKAILRDDSPEVYFVNEAAKRVNSIEE